MLQVLFNGSIVNNYDELVNFGTVFREIEFTIELFIRNQE